MKAIAATVLALVAAVVVAVAATAGSSAPRPQTITLSESDSAITAATPPSVGVHVVAAGPISGAGSGQIRTIPKGGKTDHITLHLPKGTVSLVATDTFSAVHPNYAACKANLVGRGVFTISGGTGAFKGVTGKGTYGRKGVLVGARSAAGACLPKAKPKASYVTVTLKGSAAL
jgi:hypothetical protein